MSNTSNNTTHDDIAIPRKTDKNRLLFSKFKRRLLKHVWVVRSLILLIVLLGIVAVALFTIGLVSKTNLPQTLSLAKAFLTPDTDSIKSQLGRTNILLLGKGGAEHETPDLTDSLILVSIAPEHGTMTLVSLPRDIWIADLRTKLNSVYYWGNQKQDGGGLVLAKSTVEEVVGLPIHYGVVVDFSGFEKIVSIVGSLTVDVETTFTDEKYPIKGKEEDLCDGDPDFACRFETVVFESGLREMDAETTLKFVRSRNAEGDEGTDFARSARQQRVISALVAKLKTKEILLNPKKALEIANVVFASVETDIPNTQGASLLRYVFKARDAIVNLSIPEDLLINPPRSVTYDNLYVLVTKDGGWESIHEWIQGELF